MESNDTYWPKTGHYVLCRDNKQPQAKAWQKYGASVAEVKQHSGPVAVIPDSFGCFVVDIDAGGMDAVKEVLSLPGLDDPIALITTQSKGHHLWYSGRHEGKKPWQLSSGSAGDLIGSTGYVILWDAARLFYQFGHTVFDQDTNARGLLESVTKDPNTRARGGRNNALYKKAVSALEKGDREALQDAEDEARAAGLPDAEIATTINSARKKSERKNQQRSTEVDLSEAVGAAFLGRRVFDRRQGIWRQFHEGAWIAENDLEGVETAVNAVCNLMRSGGAPERLFRGHTIKETLKLTHERDGSGQVARKKFDVGPLLGVPGGAVDLETGELLDDDDDRVKEAWITQQARVAPEVGKPKIWTKVLNEWVGGDQDYKDFLRRVCYAAITNEAPRRLIWLEGPGRNGKSKFADTLSWILGDYAHHLNAGELVLSRSERHPAGLAGLAGRRLCVVGELPGGLWDSGKLKTLSGGDKLSARFMRQNFFEFEPSHLILVHGNQSDRPGLARGVDQALRDRLALCPFQFKPRRMDKKLGAKLRAEGGRILQWILDGREDYEANGLAAPAVVEDYTESYLSVESYSGPIDEWLSTSTKPVPLGEVSHGDLYEHYKYWCMSQSQKYVTNNRFSRELGKAHDGRYQSGRNSARTKRIWKGLELIKPGELA